MIDILFKDNEETKKGWSIKTSKKINGEKVFFIIEKKTLENFGIKKNHMSKVFSILIDEDSLEFHYFKKAFWFKIKPENILEIFIGNDIKEDSDLTIEILNNKIYDITINSLEEIFQEGNDNYKLKFINQNLTKTGKSIFLPRIIKEKEVWILLDTKILKSYNFKRENFLDQFTLILDKDKINDKINSIQDEMKNINRISYIRITEEDIIDLKKI